MRFRPAQLSTLFKKFKDGDPEALESILASEKERLFDFLMRMTGQISGSMEACHDAANKVYSLADREDTLQDFLVLLYKTARGIAIEIWNADTSRLENAAYEAEELGLKDKTKQVYLALEHVVRSLPAKQREVLLLHERLGFSPDEIAEITGYGHSDVEEFFAQALGVTEAALSGDADKVPEMMTKILTFPMLDESNDGTQNLSLVFRDLKKSSRATPGGWFRLFLGLGFLSALAYAAWHHQLIFEFAQAILKQ